MVKRILIVEDEEMITESLKKLLNNQGYEVAVVHSGQEALESVKNQEFNLIVSDIRMPQMDGIETVKAIRRYRKEQGKAPVPEILITGYADEGKYQEVLALKVADYIYKPFDIKDFLESIKKNLN